jgi:hypothetical protein
LAILYFSLSKFQSILKNSSFKESLSWNFLPFYEKLQHQLCRVDFLAFLPINTLVLVCVQLGFNLAAKTGLVVIASA